jgi:mRNA interferase MazF
VLDPGTVVIVSYVGIRETKNRPSIVISTALHQTTQHDAVVALLTGNLAQARGPTDYILQDWAAAGLHRPSAFCVFLSTKPLSDVLSVIGKLTDRDWKEVQTRLRLALAVT